MLFCVSTILALANGRIYTGKQPLAFFGVPYAQMFFPTSYKCSCYNDQHCAGPTPNFISWDDWEVGTALLLTYLYQNPLYSNLHLGRYPSTLLKELPKTTRQMQLSFESSSRNSEPSLITRLVDTGSWPSPSRVMVTLLQ